MYTLYINSLSQYLGQQIGEYDNQPKNWTFADIVDIKACAHIKGRMFGAIKYKRGKDLVRKYNYVGYFKNGGVQDEISTGMLRENICALLQFTSIRFFKGLDRSDSKDMITFEGLEIRATDKEQQDTKVTIDNIQFSVPRFSE